MPPTLSLFPAIALPQNDLRATSFPPVFLLTGDSTTRSGSGWGDGFLNKTLKVSAFGINHGVNGASLPSYCASGNLKVAAYEAAYSANLRQFVLDVDNAGGIPIVVTPITGRTFSGCFVIQNLANETAKALSVAQSIGSRLIDLNKVSTAYINAIGPTAAHKYNLSPRNETNLNLWGSVIFGRLVSDLLVTKYADIKAYTIANVTLSRELAEGKPA